MKNLLTLVAALFFVTVVAHAQGGLTGDPNAIQLGQSITSTHVEIEIAGTKRGTDVANEVIFWRMGSGEVVVTINTDLISVTNAGQINEIPTLDVFQQVSKAAVAEAIRLEHITTSGTSKVFYASNVDRTGSGMGTHFAACSSTGSFRNYSITFNGDNSTITEIATAPSPLPCGGGGAIE